jgi:hypothetical protein
MNFAAHFGAFLLAPFIFASSFFGGHAAMNANMHASSTAFATTTASSTHPANWGGVVSAWRHWLNDERKDLKDDRAHATSTQATSTVSLSAIAPASGPIGTTVTLTGTGFTNDALVHFGIGVLGNATVTSSTTLSFTVPSSIGPYCKAGQPCPMYLSRITAPETYKVFVSDKNGSSNVLRFTVTKASSTVPFVSITGVSGPASLVAGTEGTWTINAALASTTGNVSYSVNWGDAGLLSALTSSSVQTQSSATFTHTYESAGTYHPTFTVTDADGHHASVSESVVVTAS